MTMPLTETQAECLSPLSLTDLLTNRVGCDAIIRALMGVRSQLHQMPLKDQSDVKEMTCCSMTSPALLVRCGSKLPSIKPS